MPDERRCQRRSRKYEVTRIQAKMPTVRARAATRLTPVKRKRAASTADHNYGNDNDVGGQPNEALAGTPKRHKSTGQDESVGRLSCPYRKRNPKRFNIREYDSCAFTYFSTFGALK